ncbi:hypothetical protein HKD37_19G054381 [Glycine soja]
MAAFHGCLYPYSGYAITHHPPQEPSLPSQFPPSPYIHPAQSLGIDFESIRIRLLALCDTRMPWFPSSVQPPLPPSLLPPTIDFASTQHRMFSLFSTTALQTVPPSMDLITPTTMLKHQNTAPSSSAQSPPTAAPTSAPSSAQPPPTIAPTTVAPMTPLPLPRFHTTNRHF